MDLVSPGWEAMIEEDQDKYLAVVPLTQAKKFGIPFLRQPLFCQQLGLFTVLGEVEPAYLTRIMKLVCNRFRYIRDYSFNTDNPVLPPSLQPRLAVCDHFTHYLPLNASYPILHQSYSRDRKINLKRAQKARLEVFESDNIRPLIQIFRENTAYKIYGGVAESAYDLLLSLFAALHSRGLAILLYTRNAAGEVDAGCLFVLYRNRITYLFNAATHKGRGLNGRSLMIDKIIKDYAGSEMVFDFESPEDIASITYFYQGFGATPARFQTIRYHNLPFLINFAKAAWLFIYEKLLSSGLRKKIITEESLAGEVPG